MRIYRLAVILVYIAFSVAVIASALGQCWGGGDKDRRPMKKWVGNN